MTLCLSLANSGEYQTLAEFPVFVFVFVFAVPYALLTQGDLSLANSVKYQTLSEFS